MSYQCAIASSSFSYYSTLVFHIFSQEGFFERSGITDLLDSAMGGYRASAFAFGQVRIRLCLCLSFCLHGCISLTSLVFSPESLDWSRKNIYMFRTIHRYY